MDIRSFLSLNPRASKLRNRKPRLLRPIRPSRANELWYKAELMRIVRLLQATAQEDLIPEIKRVMPLYETGDRLVGDAVPLRVFETMARKFGNIEGVANRLSALAARRNLETVDQRLVASVKASIGVDISGALSGSGKIARAVAEATEENVALIKSIPSEYFEKLERAVKKNLVSGARFETLTKEVARIGDVTESRAKLIARDQTSKMNSSFNEVRQTSVGIEDYTWQGAADERQRASHRSNNGRVFRWDTPPAKTGHPGHDVQCRCVAIPHIDLDKMEEELAA